MKTRFNLLTLVSGISIWLLLLGALLVVLGIFNAFLEWDIFGPQAEKVLYGVFWSCVALAAFGVATTIVVGIRDAVRSLQPSGSREGSQTESARKSSSFGQYLKAVGMLSLIPAFLVATLCFANHRILLHRTAVYKRLIGEQMERFGPRLAPLVEALPEPPRSHVPEKIHAMAEALHGESTGLDLLNAESEFRWFHLVTGKGSIPIAVLRVDGNRHENFREYSL